MSVVAATGLARVLGRSPCRNTGRSSVGKSVTATGGEPAAGSGQRVSCASPVVPDHRHGCIAEVGRHQNDGCLDSDRRSTVVDSASLHTAFSRHEIAHRETETATAEPGATAPYRAKT